MTIPRTVFACVLAFATPAAAQQQCAGVADALAGLAANYGETPRISALMGANMLIITAGPSGSWTALEVQPGGKACIVAAGEAFEVQDAPIAGDDT